jgi:hypothetical protein
VDLSTSRLLKKPAGGNMDISATYAAIFIGACRGHGPSVPWEGASRISFNNLAILHYSPAGVVHLSQID